MPPRDLGLHPWIWRLNLHWFLADGILSLLSEQEPSNFSPETKRPLGFRILSRHFTILEKLHSREYPVSEEGDEKEEGKEEGGRGR